MFSSNNPQAQVSTEGRDIELKLIQNVPAHTMLTRHYVIFFCSLDSLVGELTDNICMIKPDDPTYAKSRSWPSDVITDDD